MVWAVETEQWPYKGKGEIGATRFKAFTNSAVGDGWVPPGESVADARSGFR